MVKYSGFHTSRKIMFSVTWRSYCLRYNFWILMCCCCMLCRPAQAKQSRDSAQEEVQKLTQECNEKVAQVSGAYGTKVRRAFHEWANIWHLALDSCKPAGETCCQTHFADCAKACRRKGELHSCSSMVSKCIRSELYGLVLLVLVPVC